MVYAFSHKTSDSRRQARQYGSFSPSGVPGTPTGAFHYAWIGQSNAQRMSLDVSAPSGVLGSTQFENDLKALINASTVETTNEAVNATDINTGDSATSWWDSAGGTPTTLTTDAVSAITTFLGGDTLDGLIVDIQEGDILDGRTQAQFTSDMQAWFAYLRGASGFNNASLKIYLVETGVIDNASYSDSAIKEVHAALQAVAAADANTILAVTRSDLQGSDGVHLNGTDGYVEIGKRLARAVAKQEISGSVDGWAGPEIASATLDSTGTMIDVVITHEAGFDLVVADPTDIEGFQVFKSGGELTITSVEKLRRDAVRIHLDSATSTGSLEVRYMFSLGTGASLTKDGFKLTKTIYDNATPLSLPLRPKIVSVS